MTNSVLIICSVIFHLYSTSAQPNLINSYVNEVPRERSEILTEEKLLSQNEVKPVKSNDPFFEELCYNNQPGNYPLPYNNCNQFLMCTAAAIPYLWTCPGNGFYLAYADMCVYYENNVCPFPYYWYGSETCDSVQRPYWSNMTMSHDTCASDVIYCHDFEKVGSDQCPSGTGFSKSFLACISDCQNQDNKYYPHNK